MLVCFGIHTVFVNVIFCKEIKLILIIFILWYMQYVNTQIQHIESRAVQWICPWPALNMTPITATYSKIN